ncbi:hypothetical protein [Paenibacillus sp.]|jgi:hypothetical protein|uniref:hypothetical protein n=1 Tax=Paenibacillus sp. TaxID=58172 RepID=UPI00281AEE00|nr:hypothetical protein [Paenibacillus sp.]MDR0269617.1 hypothetical protein [Paenibacillus sp.]
MGKMNIEDAKKWDDTELDLRIDVDVFGKEEDILRSGWVKFDDFSTYPMRYSTDIKHAREVQAKAIDVDAEGYVCRLINVSGGTIFYTSDGGFDLYGVSTLLQATPREISEAAYLTLQGHST